MRCCAVIPEQIGQWIARLRDLAPQALPEDALGLGYPRTWRRR